MSHVYDQRRLTWLVRAARLMRPWFHEAGVAPPTPVEIQILACDPPYANANGCCWDEDGGSVIRIHPELVEPLEVLAVLLHELVHASVGPEWMHNGPFRSSARRLGFIGLPRHYEASQRLAERLGHLAEGLGPYPPS